MKTTKFGHGINVMFALIIIFAVVGGVVKPGEVLPLAMVIITVVMWVTARIVRDGALSLYTLIHGEDKAE